MATTILKLPRVDPQEGSDCVLVKVLPSGKRPLDMKLIGTQGDEMFSVSFKKKDTPSFRADKFTGSQDQFDHILSAVLLGTERNEDAQGIEAVARILEWKETRESKKGKAKEVTLSKLQIIVQKRVEGITSKYAELELALDQEAPEEENLFTWAALAVETRDNMMNEAESLKARLHAKEQEAAKLKQALDELIQLKTAHESELIQKFALLLNEKKLKIRDQQRILNSTIPNPENIAAIEASHAVGAHAPAPSRTRKRKTAPKEESEDEQMDVDDDAETGGDSEGENQADTPDRSTEDEASGDEQEQGMDDVEPVKLSEATPGIEEPTELPPKRALPFSTKKGSAQPANDGSETESDDEL